MGAKSTLVWGTVKVRAARRDGQGSMAKRMATLAEIVVSPGWIGVALSKEPPVAGARRIGPVELDDSEMDRITPAFTPAAAA